VQDAGPSTGAFKGVAEAMHKHNAFSAFSEGAQFAGLGETVLVSCGGTSPPAALLGENFRAQAVLNLVKFLLSLNLTKGATAPL
jgi:hypothetical protein